MKGNKGERRKNEWEISEKVDEKVLNCEGHEVFMFMGAGDISKIAHRIADKLEGKIR